MAVGGRTTLNELFALLKEALGPRVAKPSEAQPIHRDFREGDVRHSQADISKARELLGYTPTHDVRAGLMEAARWYGQVC